MLSLKQLAVFASVARHGHLGGAASDLFLSKGAVSQALAELERRLGTPLFDRVHPRLKLNDQGRQLQPMAEALLSQAWDIEHLFDTGGEPTGALHVGASQTIGNYLLPVLLGYLPQVQAKVQITNTHHLCDMLMRFELDLALIEGESHHPDLVMTPWLMDEMVVVAPPDHPLALQTAQTGDALDVAMLNDCHWVIREPYSGSREQFDHWIAPELTAIGPTMELNTLEAVMTSVVHGLGLTFISRLAIHDRLALGHLVVLPLTHRYPRQLSLIWHKQKYHGALLRRFVAFCQQQATLLSTADVSLDKASD
ncbi:LysR family transcriptional regulator [Terasakiispira papahanaumokuakeensis]|uniref:LysR family transcriptional regulator n=1 Tax=Terasakiispira papahanaumokuakeensis TaxID=197479 RepID=A0A1E2VAS8_9GAMM|nr:LysR substrate-binding domain-containing protein [Terasakiispira papahanaumokuakeensis]ODC04074.1 LysR family transcriptional regulator [Terasakiispira papahanaumokuakeensis]